MHTQAPQERYCVFTAQYNWFALPAAAVREVCATPTVVMLPLAAPTLAGICHVRNEFLPVVRLEDIEVETEGARLLVLSGAQGNWGLLARQVHALVALEATHANSYVGGDLWSGAVLGSALYREQVVKILEPQRLYRIVEQTLNRGWDLEGTPLGVAASPIAT